MMTYYEKLQWKELERLLPMLRSSLDKGREAKKVLKIVTNFRKDLDDKKQMLCEIHMDFWT